MQCTTGVKDSNASAVVNSRNVVVVIGVGDSHVYIKADFM